jgi:hypothetical protein
MQSDEGHEGGIDFALGACRQNMEPGIVTKTGRARRRIG